MAPRSAAMTLRESFGDRKIPDISRKITACVSCRKLKVRRSFIGLEQNLELTLMGVKIKCHMNNDQPPCMRCKTRGTTCTVNKSLQTLLEGDASYVAHDPRLRISLI